jgi:hypothetical protein
MILDPSRPISLDLDGPRAGTVTTLTIAPDDRIAMDASVLEIEVREAGERMLIPWGRVIALRQPLRGHKGLPAPACGRESRVAWTFRRQPNHAGRMPVTGPARLLAPGPATSP